MPVVTVVSHLAPTFEALVEQVRAQPPMADVIELRLDHIGDPGEERLRAFIAECPKAVIVSVRAPDAHGHFRGNDEERIEILRCAARAGASFVDVDWYLSLALGEVEGKCHRIVSRHTLEGTPQDLESLHTEVRDLLYEGDLIKLVTHANCAEDGLRMLRLVREVGGGMIGFCSGEAGAFTRVLAPIFGSPFTYVAPAQLPDRPLAELAAPGQMPVNDLRALLPPGGLSPGTAVFAVLGNPIGHSLSPRVHGMALKAARLDAVYVALELESFEGFLELVEDENFRGFSVTAPFKQAAFEAANECDAACRTVKACNTLLRTPSGWSGRNTDVPAIADTLERAFSVHARQDGRPGSIGAAHTLVLGTGGAARAAIGALREAGGRVSVAGRDAPKAETLASELGCEVCAWDDIAQLEYDALVHCTPVGSLAQPDALPIPEEWLRSGVLVLDAVYRPLQTPLLAATLAKGGTPVPGGEWFVRQAQRQFELFTSQPPDESLLRAAFETALGGFQAPSRT